MTFQYVKTKDELPDPDFECPICLQNINVDETVEGVPNCVICINGHRAHNICWSKWSKHMCPCCKTNDIKFCKSIRLFIC